MSREAMQMALEAFDALYVNDYSGYEISKHERYIIDDAVKALRQALVDADDTSQDHVGETVKQEHEPVAWANSFDLKNFDMKVRTCPDLHHTVPLYTAPPKREWVGLTDEEIAKVISGQFAEQNYWVKITRAIEAKLKEKNT
jgi:hypothetical protein